VSEGAVKKEEKPRKFQAIRGTRDLLPPETALWNRVEQTAHEVFGTFGFGEIRIPIFEPTELFARSIGEETDVVSKEMYTFVDRLEKLPDPPTLGDYGAFIEQAEKLMATEELPSVPGNRLAIERMKRIWDRGNVFGTEGESPIEKIDSAVLEELYKMVVLKDSMELGQSISLRPEATASVCRAYIEHNMQQLPQPVKLYYMGPMFRRERPQKGRYRQFYQIGAEVLGGSDAPAIDAEVIEMVMTFFDRLELQGVQLDINSIGCRECRPKYVELLRAELLKVKDKLGPDSQRRIETNPLRVLDSKLESEQGIIATLPRIADHLCEDCAAHYAAVKRQLEMRGVIYRENWRLVRGLDYYMRTTFEITAQGLGSQNAVCGGGRYDGLVELLGGPPTKGIGFAIGEDRLVLSLTHHKPVPQRRAIDVVLAWLSPAAYTKAVDIARNLRREGIYVELPAKLMRAGDAVRYADRIGAFFTLMIGEDELKSGELTLKHMLRQEQIKITETSLVDHIKKRRELKEAQ